MSYPLDQIPKRMKWASVISFSHTIYCSKRPECNYYLTDISQENSHFLKESYYILSAHGVLSLAIFKIRFQRDPNEAVALLLGTTWLCFKQNILCLHILQFNYLFLQRLLSPLAWLIRAAFMCQDNMPFTSTFSIFFSSKTASCGAN